MANGIIDYYEYFLGPFPWSEFNIVQINTYGYGQAPPGTMHITNEAFNPTLTEVDQVFSEGINERFAHEIAHPPQTKYRRPAEHPSFGLVVRFTALTGLRAGEVCALRVERVNPLLGRVEVAESVAELGGELHY